MSNRLLASSWLANSDELLQRRDVPRHLPVDGGGYIGCEFASIYRSIESTVTGATGISQHCGSHSGMR